MVRRVEAVGRAGRSAARARVARRIAVLLACTAALGAPAAAQTLAEVTLVTAISSQLYPGLSLPSGSFRAVGPGTDALVARIPDAHEWTDWEVYTARGLVRNLENALVYGAQRDLILEGYWDMSQQEIVVDGTTHVRIVFEGERGRALIYLIRDPDALVWLLARSR
jgi:hypothetical protein